MCLLVLEFPGLGFRIPRFLEVTFALAFAVGCLIPLLSCLVGPLGYILSVPYLTLFFRYPVKDIRPYDLARTTTILEFLCGRVSDSCKSSGLPSIFFKLVSLIPFVWNFVLR